MKSLKFLFTFSCILSLNFLFGQVKDFDGNNYGTTKIGDKTWLTQNLAVTHFRNGDEIKMATSFDEWMSFNKYKEPAYMYYNFDPVNGLKYGVLYNFYAVNDKRGLSPKEFHIPSTIEWEKLFISLFGDSKAIPDLLANTEWHYYVEKSNEEKKANLIKLTKDLNSLEDYKMVDCFNSNSTRFSALPAPVTEDENEQESMFLGATYEMNADDNRKLAFTRDDDMRFYNHTSWWTSTKQNENSAWARSISGCSQEKARSSRNLLNNNYGLYVRCIKD